MPVTTSTGSSGGEPTTVTIGVSHADDPGPGDDAPYFVDVFLCILPSALRLTGNPNPPGKQLDDRCYRWCDVPVTPKGAAVNLTHQVEFTYAIGVPTPALILAVKAWEGVACTQRVWSSEWVWLKPSLVLASPPSTAAEEFRKQIEEMIKNPPDLERKPS